MLQHNAAVPNVLIMLRVMSRQFRTQVLLVDGSPFAREGELSALVPKLHNILHHSS